MRPQIPMRGAVIAARRLALARCSTRHRFFSTQPAPVEDASALQPVTAVSEDEAMMREAARRFATDEVLPLADSMDKASEMPPELITSIFDAGFMGVEVDEKHGGSGSSFTAACIVIEELAKADPAVSVMVDIHNTIVNNTFSMWASPELQHEWLPRLATDTLGAFCLSEASSGSDAFALKTTARRDAGGDYLISGEKMWISNSAEAGVFLVMANAAPDRGYKGITCFVVPAGTAGLSIGVREEKLGIKASSTCPVRFDEVRVPADAVLGEVGMGYKYAIEILNEGRIGIGCERERASILSLHTLTRPRPCRGLPTDTRRIPWRWTQAFPTLARRSRAAPSSVANLSSLAALR